MDRWEPQFFGSGTTIVTRVNAPKQPHLYIYGPGSDDEGRAQAMRYAMCHQLADWLNGGERPAWMDDMRRDSERSLIGCDNSSIYATGPSYDANPPHLFWRECDDDESRNARARLIDRLCGIGAEA